MKKPWRKRVPVEGGPLTPLALRQIAGWLDLGDEALAILATQQGKTYVPEDHDNVQVDVRRWADELEQGRLVTALRAPTQFEDKE